MVECSDCRLWYLNPMPTEQTLESLYDSAYFESESASRLGYEEYGKMADDFRATFRRRLELVDAHVGAGRLLDVGAGFGYLADAAVPRFRERWVVELSEAAARRVDPAHRVLVGRFETVDLPDGYFDVVSMQDCLEHLPEPRAALAKIRRLLRPGGALLAVTPNVRSWLALLQGQNWVSLKFPEHVVLYSEATLRRALGEAGLRVERVVPAGQYARLDFLAERVASGHPRLAGVLARWARRMGGDERRLYVPSGSLAVVATSEG
jgi:SAM-dependent methyltransferase